MSKYLSNKNLSLSIYEKEMLAIVMAIQKWRPYILGRHFKVKTDHYSLKFLMKQRIHTQTQQKWLTKLMGYNFEITYKKGSENIMVDALSLEFSLIAISIVNSKKWGRIQDS